jgi:hypothetical protein
MGFFLGRRGIFQPLLISITVLLFSSLVGYDFPISFTLSTLFSSIFSSSNTVRAFWEDMAINRVILMYGREGGFLIPYLLTVVVSLIVSFSTLLLSFLIYNFFGFREILGVLVWTFSSGALTSTISIIGEMARVNLEFFSAILLIPLLLGIYGFLSSENPWIFFFLMLVMGLFYLSFAYLLSDIFFEV